MSRIDNRESTDSLIAKIKSGVETYIVKNIPDFLSFEPNSGLYVYTSGDIVSIDDQIAYVVYFE